MPGIFIVANVNDSDYLLPLTDGTALLNTQLIFFHPVINLDEICNKLWACHELTKPCLPYSAGAFKNSRVLPVSIKATQQGR